MCGFFALPSPLRSQPRKVATQRAQPTPANPGGARQRDDREFGAETGLPRATHVNSPCRARLQLRDSDTLESVADPLKYWGSAAPSLRQRTKKPHGRVISLPRGLSCGSRIRTDDLEVMSLAISHTFLSRFCDEITAFGIIKTVKNATMRCKLWCPLRY